MNKIITMITVGIGLTISSISATAAAGPCGQARTLDKVVACVFPQISNLQIMIMAVAYLGGIVLAFKGVMKLKEHHDKKGQMSIGIPIVMVVAGALLLALPTAMNFGMITLGIAGWQGDVASSHGGGTFDYNQFKY